MIHFNESDIPCRVKRRLAVKSWLKQIIESRNKSVGEISIVMCSDKLLLETNQKYLNHDYYTDIITFDYTEKDQISGDLMISYERVKENAKKENVAVQDELRRVMAHGVLHLLGFKDKSEREAAEMRTQEDAALDLFHVEHSK
ncbi:MAG: rRNA maturation RNase YbeY [Flavobacteriales bacterium]|nr:rRNA maturation RNase YbeY [Flavobacteriales bacterium]